MQIDNLTLKIFNGTTFSLWYKQHFLLEYFLAYNVAWSQKIWSFYIIVKNELHHCRIICIHLNVLIPMVKLYKDLIFNSVWWVLFLFTDAPVLISVLLTVPSIVGVLYLLIWQNVVLRIEYIWCTLMLSLQTLEFIFAMMFVVTMCRGPSYD